jgi:mono/diheme cytochrome c family protein
MNSLRSLKPRLQGGLLLATILALACAMSIGIVLADDAKAPAAKSPPPPAPEKTPAKKAEKPALKKLTGAELYQIHCNRCHPERYATEWNSSEWKTLMTHMRVRANLPPAQAKQVLKYLQEDSGN